MRRALSPKDPLVQECIKLATNRDYRLGKKRCVISGTKLVQDVGKRHRLHDLLAPPGAERLCQGIQAAATHVAEERSLRRIAQVTSFDGLVATLDLPAARKDEDFADPRLILALDYIGDPGMLGTLLRTAMAFQWHAIFFLPRCADPFDPKSVRASQGALFELPYLRGNIKDLQSLCHKRSLQLCVSHSAGVDIGSASYESPAHGMALLLREEYSAPWSPPRDAVKLRVPDPWPHAHAHGFGDTHSSDAFDPRALDVAVAGGVLMHHIRHFHFPWVSRSPYVASPR